MFPFFDILISTANFLHSPFVNINLPVEISVLVGIGFLLLELLSESSRKD
jgi:hypothetical protein